ncbi:60S ribosomal protein L23 [Penicillium crustosum]|nr:60S ribosomal protein L23 [Penicillium crustosum]KAJ5401436.1 60S ribosomal protein L23 [Penicillium crustosum]
MVMATVKKEKPSSAEGCARCRCLPEQAGRRPDGIFLYLEDSAGVIVNAKGEMKGSANCRRG